MRNFFLIWIPQLIIAHLNAGRVTRSTVPGGAWPGGEVAYVVAPHFTRRQQSLVREAMAEIEAASCVTFRTKQPRDVHWLNIENRPGRGCWSWYGLQRTGRGQSLNLAPHCLRREVQGFKRNFAKIEVLLSRRRPLIGPFPG